MLLSANALQAYQTSLDDGTIQAAYSLGRRNDAVTAEFVEPYLLQRTEEGTDGIHNAFIEVLTPFLQIVDRSRKNADGYTLEQARKDYRGHADNVVVRISILLVANYPTSENSAEACDNTPLQPENVWKNFAFIVRQRGKLLSPKSMTTQPLLSTATKENPSRLDGADFVLEFDAKEVASEALEVEIVTPHCKNIVAKFDLNRLR
jgi:hypothetical protein